MTYKKYKVNDIGFLYNYFKAFEISVHTDPSEVTYNNKNYIFRSSNNDYAYHSVRYVFDNEPEMLIQINKDQFQKILTDIKLKAHKSIYKQEN